VPVLPSDIDIHAAAKCISNLLLIAKIRRDEQRIAVIANRVKKQTLVYKSLMKFLETLQIPVVTTLRDSQTYLRAAETGRGIFEMKPHTVREDLEQWLPLVGWLSQRKTLHIEPGSPALTSALTSAPRESTQSLDSIAPAAAAAMASVADGRSGQNNSSHPSRSAPHPLSPTLISQALSPSPTRQRLSESLLPSLIKRVFG
jgi:chromosome partitioning protein